jgi:parallel beta-helix repeat protein
VRFALTVLLFLVACGDDKDDPGPPQPAGTVYVDAGAAEGGTGAESAPFRTVDAALDSGIPHLVVASGTYEFPTEWTFGAAYVIEAPQGAFVTTSSVFTAPNGVTLRGFQVFGAWTITGDAITEDVKLTGEKSGFSVHDGEVTVANLSLEDGTGAVFVNCTGTVASLEATGVIAPVFTAIDSELTISDLTIVGAVQTDEEGASGDGFVLDGGTVTVEDSVISDPDDRAFTTRRGTATLRRVQLHGGARPAVASADEAVVTVEACEIFAAPTCLFATGGGTLTVRNSDVHDCGYGMLAGMGAKVDVQDSRFTNCPGGHFSALNPGTQVLLQNNEFRDADGTCVALAGTNGPGVRVADNIVDDCVGQGISLLSLTGAEIEGNTISNVAADPVFVDVGDGVGLVDASAMVVGNTITDVAQRGIGLLRSTGTYRGNTISDTGDLGISVVDPGDEPATITDNSVARAFGGGITVLNADANITDNEVSDVAANVEFATGDGITFGLGSTATVTGNTVTDASYNGIVFAEGATGTIESNTVTGSGRHGIQEYCFSEENSVLISGNTLSDNALGDQQLCE